MRLHGLSHIGLSTLDLDATRTFYERVLGFRLVRIEQIDLEEGGCIRHAFFDCGDGELLGFMEPRGIKAVPAAYDTGINRGLGVPDWLPFSLRRGLDRRVACDAFGADRQGYQGHADGRSRLDLVDLLQGSQRPITRIRRADSRARRPPGKRGPTHYGYLAPTVPYHRFP